MKHHTCDHLISWRAAKQKDTDTTSGSGSPEAANRRKLREYYTETITQCLALALHSSRAAPPQPRPAGGYWQRQTMALGQEELSSHLACVSLAHLV